MQSLNELLFSRPVDWEAVRDVVSANPAEAGFQDQNLYTRSQLQKCLQIDDCPPPADVVRAVLKANPGAAVSVDKGGRTALYYACIYKCPLDVVSVLLETNPEAAKQKSANGNTPLHVAFSEQVARLLLKYDPSVVAIRSSKGELPLHSAVRWGTPDLVRTLIEQGEKPGVGLLGAGALDKDKDGRSPLDGTCEMICSMTTNKILNETKTDNFERNFFLSKSDFYSAWDKLEAIVRAAYLSYAPPNAPFLLLHALIELDCPLKIIRLGTMAHPEQIVERDYGGRVPVAKVASPERQRMEQLLRQRNCIRMLLRPKDMFASLEAVTVQDNDGRFPLNSSLVNGGRWFFGVRELFFAEPRVASTRDTLTGMYSFMIAALRKGEDVESDIDTIYSLLRECPEVLRFFLP